VADLSLTLAMAREVGNSLLTDSLLAESNRHLNQMYGLLESMDDGVMAWNEQGILQFLNPRRRGYYTSMRRRVREKY
jgi:transcriptional activator for dhaKLM operon